MSKGVIFIFGWIGLFVIFNLTGSDAAARATVATTLGGSAFILMAVSIVLATRPRALESAFGGLDRMYQVHKMAGVSALLLVLIHFFASPEVLPPGTDEIANALVPSAPLGMISMVLLILSIVITLNRKIAYHVWRKPHRVMGVLFILIFGHMVTTPDVFFTRGSAGSLMLLLTGLVGIGAYLYTQILASKRAPSHQYTLVEVNKLERASELVLAPQGEKLSFKPGQFAFIEIEAEGFNEPHPFTISSAPSEANLRFTTKVLGDWTRKVRDDLEAGAAVKVTGPYGKFDPAESTASKQQVWVAGGIGITPFLSALRQLQSDDNRHITLLYAVREKAEALFLEELQAIANAMPNVTVKLFESNNGEFVTAETLEQLGQVNQTSYFMCGPKAMVSALIKHVKPSAHSVHHEYFEFR
ncbi:MAG: ferric reductase-like transmembrane domain-containing protein [Gammaproteobacteria bacterium]|nr:ferric reductase-like transmembrane domain-containing protein [Gammaproteobacteria bacterium]